ncbi:MAG: GNAT family N-acetyltransferase [Caulobacterales bacterium]
MSIEIRTLGAGDDAVLGAVAPEVFDDPVDPGLTREFLADPRHHIAVAVDDGVVVGFASAVHYIHPDKPRELWINEVAVAPTHHRRGLGKGVMRAILDLGRSLGCRSAWVLTDRDNTAAVALYISVGGQDEAKGDAVVMFEFDLAS